MNEHIRGVLGGAVESTLNFFTVLDALDKGQVAIMARRGHAVLASGYFIRDGSLYLRINDPLTTQMGEELVYSGGAAVNEDLFTDLAYGTCQFIIMPNLTEDGVASGIPIRID